MKSTGPRLCSAILDEKPCCSYNHYIDVASYLYLYAKLPDECEHASDDIVHNVGRLKHADVEKMIDLKVCQVLAKEHTVDSGQNHFHSALP